MLPRLLFVVGLFLAVSATSFAQGDKVKAPIGTWTRTVGDNKLEFKFEAKSLIFTHKEGDNTIRVEADYAIARDGTVFGRIAKVQGGDNAPKAGLLFSFRIKTAAKSFTLSELTGTDSNEVRDLIEGEYKAK
jgi:hypothetical protein